MRKGLFALALWALCLPVQAQPTELLDRALQSARQSFERAASQLGASIMGVDTAAYGEAIRHRRVGSRAIHFVIQETANGSCARFAAYVGKVEGSDDAYLFLCPQFFSPGADALRETTILHELVHVIAGPDECRAMSYTAHLQMLAAGVFQPVALYWQAHDCSASRYSLPG